MKSGGRRSIRRTVLALFAASIVLSVALLAAFEAAVSSYYRGESSVLTRYFKATFPAIRGMRAMVKVMRSFNAALLKGPDAPLDGAFLAEAASDAAPLAVALRIEDRIAFSSLPRAPISAAQLPAFGAPAPEQQYEVEEPTHKVVYQFDFRTGDGRSATFFLIRPAGPEPRRLPFSRQLGLVIALILLAADGAAGVYFILRVTGPLRRVEAAALAMSRGDLRTPIEGSHQILELARVFAALETMRSEISELLDRERKSEAGRRELIANLSHDLRTPLAAIRGYVDGIRDGIADTPEKRARYLAVLGQKIQDLDRMIGQIFLLSTLEARESPPDFKTIDLRAFLRDCVEELRLSLGGGPPRIVDVGLDGPPCPVSLDPLQFRRVLENLVDNAVKHGGRSSLELRIGLERAGPKVRLEIEDNGRGIPRDESARVFDRFYRIDPSRSVGGLGLGLAISRQIVEAHGGTISVAPGEAGGARFAIELPIRESTA